MKNRNQQINKIKEYLTSTLHAVVADDSLQIDFSSGQRNNFFNLNQNLVADEKRLLLPQINFDENSSIKHFRSLSDLAACYVLFHDKKISLPNNLNEEEENFFNSFERIRVIANVKDSYRGIVKNILSKIEQDISTAELDEFQAISLILLNDIFADETQARTKNLAINLEEKLSKKIAQSIKNLSKKISNQKDFTKEVAQILDLLKQEQEASEQEETKQDSTQNQDSNDDLANFANENVEAKDQQQNFSQEIEEEKSQGSSKQEEVSNFESDDEGGDVSIRLDEEGYNEEGIAFKNPYKIFSSKFDDVVFPQKMVGKNDLETLRDQLDLRLTKLSTISKKMTLKLKRKLLSKKNMPLEFDASRGVLNRKKLSRLVIDPMMEDIWINQKSHEYQDTALTILLDNSGSMRGNPIVMSALACEIIASILEKFSVKTEIIGFTTADWKGGRVRKLWESVGSPKNPGRLNELRHIIYKQFNQNFKKSKLNLGLMLKEGVLKENIDGEALLFARSRLLRQDQSRKILLVISDGAPVDDSTASANDSDILSDHLRHVVGKIENSRFSKSKIEIVGIGIGHTTEEFYRNSITIKNSEELGDAMIEKISELL